MTKHSLRLFMKAFETLIPFDKNEIKRECLLNYLEKPSLNSKLKFIAKNSTAMSSIEKKYTLKKYFEQLPEKSQLKFLNKDS